MTTKTIAKLTEFTPEQEALIDQIGDAYLADALVPREPVQSMIDRWLAVAYAACDLPVPKRVEIMPSPKAALALASELVGEKQTYADWWGVRSGGWVARSEFAREIGIQTAEEEKDIDALRGFARVAWDTVLLDECAIVIRRPMLLKVDDDGNLHAAGGPCVEWKDGEKEFAWHGTWIPERMATDPRSYTKAEYLAISNSEERRALSEINGWAWVADLLGASIVDTWKDPKTGLLYELMAYDGGKLLRMTSPELRDGRSPLYIEPVHEDLRTAQAARKWQATDWTPERCEADPALSYGVEA
jgi:hypothetical protein